MLSLPCRQLSQSLLSKNAPVRCFNNRAGSFRVVRPQAKVKYALNDIISREATDRPFFYGKLALAGGATLGVGALCFYGLGLSKESGAIDQAAFWPEYVRSRIHKTYAYLGTGLGLTAGSAVMVLRSPALMQLMMKNSVLSLVGTFAAMIGTAVLCRGIPYTPESLPLKLAAWASHCGVMGAVVAPLALMGGPLVLRAAIYTAGIVAGLSALAACAPNDKFLRMGGALSMGFGVVFAASIGTFFLPPTSMVGAGLYSIALYGGLVLFAFFLLSDTQRMVKQARDHPAPHNYAVTPFDPINAQLNIYVNTLNIFIRVAMILAGSNNRRK